MIGKRFLFWAWFSLGWLVTGYSQQLSPRIENITQDITSLIYSNKYDSAQVLVLTYIEQTDLSNIEVFYGHLLLAEIMKSTGRPENAIVKLQLIGKFLGDIAHKTKYESLIEGKIAECHFDLMNYEDAKKHALVSIRTNPDSSLRVGGHAVNHLIIGFSNYIEKDYKSSLDHYSLAIRDYLDHGESCELPLAYTKMAQVYNVMGNKALTEEHINMAVFISDTCDIEAYKLLSKHARLDIYNKNKNYKKALETLLEINDLVHKLENKKQAQVISELEIKYETKLMKNEYDALKKINQKNEELVAKHKQALLITALAIVVLSILTIALIWISVKRKQAEQNLTVLNAELEQKVDERTDHLHKANEKIKEDSELLDFQNKQLVDFCNIISHNLRSPLTNMSMLVDYIEKSEDETEQLEFIDKLRPVITNLNETFGELVESLQVRQDRNIKFEKTLLEDCLKKNLDGLEGEIIKSGAIIETNFDEAPVIYYPPKYLSSILHNLVSNSLKYRSPLRKPVIQLSTKKINGSILLSVKDNGLGIDLDKYKDQIFKIRKVFHDHPDAKGFGLYITKTQVETMNGKIWVESTLGEGSTFFVEIKNQDN